MASQGGRANSNPNKGLKPWAPDPSNPGVPAGTGPKHLGALALKQAIFSQYPDLIVDCVKTAQGIPTKGIKQEDLTADIILTARYRLLDKVVPNIKPITLAEFEAAADVSQEMTNESTKTTRSLIDRILGIQPQSAVPSGPDSEVVVRDSETEPAGGPP